MKSSIQTWIVYLFVPYSQRGLAIIAKMIAQLSAKLDIWAYNAAQKITHPMGGNRMSVVSILMNNADNITK